MTDYRERLDQIIDSFLAQRVPFDAFQRAYSDCYIDEQADAGFTAEEIDHYGVVHEKAEWTSTAPAEEDRKNGWLDVAQFREWLAVHERHKPHE